MSSATRSRLLSLPQELLENIINLFDSSPTLNSLREEPTPGMTQSDCQPLKNLSLTCRFMRPFAFNQLFEYTKLRLTILCDENHWDPSRIHESEVNDFLAFMDSRCLTLHIRSVVIYALEFTCDLPEPDSIHLQGIGSPGSAVNKVLSALDPELFTVIASPIVLSSLTSCYINHEDAWAFAIPLQVFHLRQSPRLERTMKPTLSAPYGLSGSRPWTHCLINEGSSIPVYQTYEYYLKTQPSILPSITHRSALLGRKAYTTLESLEHITIYPTSNHITIIDNFIRSLPNLKRLTLSLRPPACRDFLSDAMKRHKVDLSDVWVGYREMNRIISGIMECPPHSSPIRELNLLNHFDCTGTGYQGDYPTGWQQKSLTSYVRDSFSDNSQPLEN